MSGGYFSYLWSSTEQPESAAAATSAMRIQTAADVILSLVSDKNALLQDSAAPLRDALLALMASGQLDDFVGNLEDQKKNSEDEKKKMILMMTTMKAKKKNMFSRLPYVLLAHIIEWMKSLDELRMVEEALQVNLQGKLCWQRGIVLNSMRPNKNAFCSRLEYDSRDALMWSARIGLLAKQRHPVKITEYLRGRRRTHFTWMCENNMTHCVNAMLERPDTDVNEVDSGGWGPLDYASFEGHVDIVRRLIKKGADVNKPGNKQKRTPLHEACRNGHLPVVRLLISRVVNINQTNYTGWTPLYLAMYGGHDKVEEFLLSMGATPYTCDNTNGRTAEGWGNLDRIVERRDRQQKEKDAAKQVGVSS